MDKSEQCSYKPFELDFKCNSVANKIKSVYLFKESDCIIENGVIVRMKRKYGNNKRIITKIEYNSNGKETV
jgi:hypothetical protein